MRAGVAASSAEFRKDSSVGGKKAKINGNSSFSQFQHSERASARRGGRRGEAASLTRFSAVDGKSSLKKNLLPQNFNGLAKRLHLPSGGAVISAISHELRNKEDVGRVLGDVCHFGYAYAGGKARFSAFVPSDLR